MSSSTDLDGLASGARHLLDGKYFQLAAFVMLIYDHILTFSQEVDRIWRRKFSGATLLFLINRYVTPLQFIIILDAFHDPAWSKNACSNFVVFEGASTVALVAVCQLIMILRVYALYNRSTRILLFLMVLWALQIIISAVGLHTGFTVVPLPPMLTGCILTGSSTIFPSVWVAPLVTDTCIFGLTLLRTRRYLRDSGTTPTIYIFVRDGTLYFLAIFAANLMNTLLFFLAPSDLKAIGASFSQLITAVMISRLVLNLRIGGSVREISSEEDSYYDHGHSGKRIHGRKVREVSFMTRTIGNLGADIGASTTEDERSQIPMINVSKRKPDVPVDT